LKFSSYRFTNITLLGLLILLTLSGGYGLFWTLNGWVFTIHRAAGWALIALLPWKVAISIKSLRRGVKPNIDRGVMIGVSLFLTVVTLAVLGLGLLWKGRFGPEEYWLRQTAISWHWMLALGLLVPLALHVWRRWPSLKRVDLTSRRAVMRAAVVGLLGLIGFSASKSVAVQRELPDSPVRFTGSRRQGYFNGNDYPVTHTIPARPDQVDPQSWRLRVGGQVNVPFELTYQDLLALPVDEKDVTLDCTLGWYTVQTWRGVPLLALLERAGTDREPASVRLESVTGYSHVLPFNEAKEILLATHVSGETLEHNHGFPVRAVVPSRRGWFWVKWLAKIEFTGDFV